MQDDAGMRYRLALLAAVVVFFVFVTQAAEQTPSVPQPPEQTTTTWTLPSAPSGGIVDDAQAEACAGYFGSTTVATDQNGRQYLPWGGWQQCSPAPASQQLLIQLWRLDPDGWDLADVDSYTCASCYVLNGYTSTSCSGTQATVYYMKAYGTANGVNLSPYPASSASSVANCYVEG